LEIKKHQKILVTGATGYLGNCISNGLERLGLNITRGSRKYIQTDSFNSKNWIQTNWQDSSLRFLDDFDYIIHAAGPSAIFCSGNIDLAKFFYEDINTHLINKLAKKKNKGLILLSTVQIYSSPLSGIITESHPLTNRHPYVFFRRRSEKLFLNFIESGKISGCILRLGNCFGLIGSPSGDFYKLYINQICNDIIRNNQIIIKSNPMIKRDFFPVGNLQDAIEIVLGGSSKDPVYNLISGKSKTLLEVAKNIAFEYQLISGFEAKILYDQKKEKTFSSYDFDATLCQNLIGLDTENYTFTIKNTLLALKSKIDLKLK
jgi:nucleoside-diphosphate-sugar epimerase